MAPETLTCVEGVTPERLSALRDAALSPDTERRLRAHVAGCPACQSRLASYDALAVALRQAPELEPGERIVAGVRARLASQRRPPRARGRLGRRAWAGVAALAPVAALILLFVYVFAGLGRSTRGGGAPLATQTATLPAVTPPAIPSKPIYPTATPATITLPSFTPAVSPAVAWGGPIPIQTFTTPSQANTRFDLTSLSPDLRTLVGEETSIAPQTPGATPVPHAYDAHLITYDLASGAITQLGPTWPSYNGPEGSAIFADNRYISYSFNSQPGATGGIYHNELWMYDRQTQTTWGYDTNGGAQQALESGDRSVFMRADNTMVYLADFTTRQVSPLAIPGYHLNSDGSINADLRIFGFTWPYLIYSLTTSTGNGNATTAYVLYNLQTQAQTPFTPPTFPYRGSPDEMTTFISAAGLVGATLYLEADTEEMGVNSAGQQTSVSYGSLYAIPHIFVNPTAAPQLLARWPIAQTDNGYGQDVAGRRAPWPTQARLLPLPGGYVWDTAEGRLVSLGGDVGVSLVGGDLLTLRQTAASATPTSDGQVAPVYSGAVYATTQFPINTGG